MKKPLVIALAAVWCIGLAGPLLAQQPRVVNARLSARPAQPDLARAVTGIVSSQAEPAWIGYFVPVYKPSEPRNDGWSERCRLEQTPADRTNAATPVGPIKLEPSPLLMVLFRVQDRQLQRVRTFSADCELDAGGLPFYWFDNVPPAQSVAYLRTLVTDLSASKGPSEAALSALAMHNDPSASTALLDMARNGTAPRLRERSLFWVARRAEVKALPVITDAIANDPEVAVKKQAVFALSQLPNGEGIPLLITLSKSTGNPEVRKQAMFWLGQSKDPRALSYFEQLLR